MFHRSLPLILAVAASAFASADINYVVTPNPEAGKLQVEMTFRAPKGAFEVQMPNWSPGAYMLRDMGANVSDFTAKDGNGKLLEVDYTNGNSWKSEVKHGGLVSISYTVASAYSEGAMHYSGPSTYLYVVNMKEENCTLKLKPPIGWKIAVGLDAIGDSYFDYSASDYDVLADNPVTLGDFVDLRYTSHGKPITIALRGAPRNNVDRNNIIRVCKKITDGQGDFFGGLPFNKYIWHFSVTPRADGAGGLEHLSSTQISLAQGVGPVAKRVLAHEFFHLWNVKRIRSRVLGPFDYTELPETGALYWLEGVTDYYSSLLSYRDGVLDRSTLLGDIVSNTTAIRNNEARFEVSPYESSMRVGETNNGRGNSNGYKLSYYNYGWVVGLCLDIEMRDRTNGKYSLDDVTKALWELCKDDKPGFSEDEIRKQYVRFGGRSMGKFFDDVVMNPGKLPLEDVLAKVGYELSAEQVPYTDNGFSLAPSFGSGNINIGEVRESAAKSGLKTDDVLIAVNGVDVKGKDLRETMTNAFAAVNGSKVGQVINVKISRDGTEHEFEVIPVEAFRSVWKVTDVADGDVAKLKLRENWFYSGKKH